MILPVIAAAFLLLYGILFSYYLKAWRALPIFVSDKAEYKFLSVIIPARNEEKNIVVLLNALAEQTYPKEYFEIIVVDDFSTDATAGTAKSFPLNNLRLIHPNAPPNQSSKKKAIETGVHHAKGELIITTDADCTPPKNWLATINDFYVKHNAAFIAAPVKFCNDGSFLEIFQSLDFLTLQGITAASVAGNFHTMCNGANLAYKKEIFFEVKGFEGIDKVATGDDMLLMYKIWKQYPDKVFYLKSKDVIVSTQPMPTWKDFFNQRKRWASKTLVYDDFRIIAVLLLVLLVNCCFIALIIASVINSFYWWFVLGFWLSKTIIEFPFVASVSRFYNEQKLMNYFFLFQPVHMLYTVVVGIWSQFGKYEWKGRKTK